MADAQQSLGDQPKPDLVLSRFTEPLPSGRREIVAKFESILNRGGVQKVTVQIGKPIEVVDKLAIARWIANILSGAAEVQPETP